MVYSNYIFLFPVHSFLVADHQGSSQSDLCINTGFSLNSRPVDGYRKGGATPICIRSPAQCGSWDMLHVGLGHVGSLHAILHVFESPVLWYIAK